MGRYRNTTRNNSPVNSNLIISARYMPRTISFEAKAPVAPKNRHAKYRFGMAYVKPPTKADAPVEVPHRSAKRALKAKTAPSCRSIKQAVCWRSCLVICLSFIGGQYIECMERGQIWIYCIYIRQSVQHHDRNIWDIKHNRANSENDTQFPCQICTS